MSRYFKNNVLKKCKNCISIRYNRPDLLDVLVNKEDGEKACGDKRSKILIKCNVCGKEKTTTPNLLYLYGYNCNYCGIKISIPERFIINILIDLNIDFETQKTFDWIGNKKYDIYIKSINTIIEINGEQHYVESFKSFGVSLESIQKNDKYKKDLAIKNGITNYIEIDCRKSEVEWLKLNSIKSLKNIIDIHNVNWDSVVYLTFKNMTKLICENWNELEIKKVNILSKKLKISEKTIRKYLRIGESLNLCKFENK